MRLIKLTEKFGEINFFHLSKDKNQFIVALVALALMTKIGFLINIQPLQIKARDSLVYFLSIEVEPDRELWFHHIK